MLIWGPIKPWPDSRAFDRWRLKDTQTGELRAGVGLVRHPETDTLWFFVLICRPGETDITYRRPLDFMSIEEVKDLVYDQATQPWVK